MAELTTLAAVKRSLRLGGNAGAAVTDHDDFLNDLIPAATSYCQKKTRRTLVLAASTTRIYDGNGSDVIDLVDFPINSIASVHEDYERAFGASTLLAATDYYLDSGNGLLYRAAGTPWIDWPQSIRVAMSVGWSTIPPALERAAIRLISYWYNTRTLVGIESRSVGDDSESLRLPDDVRKEIDDMLWPFRSHGMAI